MSLRSNLGPVTEPAVTALSDLADSLDVRLVVAGVLSPAVIPIRRDRAELAAVLARAGQPRPEWSANGDPERNHR